MTETERIVRCPTCAKSVRWHSSNAYRPFCSDRCQIIDLGGWASETHRIPGESIDENNDPESEGPNQ